MSFRYKKELSQQLKLHLESLRDSRGAHQHQLYENALHAINAVMENPLNPNFRKNLPENYKAVDVLQQYRLFFRIVHPPESSSETVFFQWMNDEASLHRTNDPDDCYKVFAEMHARGDLEPFEEDPEPESAYTRRQPWGAEFVYVEYVLTVGRSRGHASTMLTLSRKTKDEYVFQYVH